VFRAPGVFDTEYRGVSLSRGVSPSLPGCFDLPGFFALPPAVFRTRGVLYLVSHAIVFSIPGWFTLPGCFKPEGCNTLRVVQRPRGVSHDGVCNSDGVKHAGGVHTDPVRTPPSVRLQLTVSGSYAPSGSYHLAVFGVKHTDDASRS
jgi:hypothetical protein